MDPNSGKLYPSIEAAMADGVKSPVEVLGLPKDVERVSLAVKKLHQFEKKKKRKQAEKARRSNR